MAGEAGTGKTVFALEAATAAGEAAGRPSLVVAFEESAAELSRNAGSFDWAGGGRLADNIRIRSGRLPEDVLFGGDFDLGGLLAQIDGAMADEPPLVVLDGLDVLLDPLVDGRAIRRELLRLQRWLAERGVTAVVTAKGDARSDGDTGRYGFLPYLADCVVELHHWLVDRVSQRGIRIAKYRGSNHDANVFPFTLNSSGVNVMSAGVHRMHHVVRDERVSSGIERLDAMLEGGYHVASSVLVSGSPGTAKTTLAGSYAAAAAGRSEQVLYVSFDESAEQIQRNLRSVAIDLTPHVDSGDLRFLSLRARFANPGMLLERIDAELGHCDAEHLIVDPISVFANASAEAFVDEAAAQLVDLCKERGITLFSTTLLEADAETTEATAIGLSTVADTWIHLSYAVQAGERNRALTIVKARGTAHSNQVRELILSRKGLDLADVYTAGGRVLMGTLRWEKEQERARHEAREAHAAKRRRLETELSIAENRAQLEKLEQELRIREDELRHLDEEAADREAAESAHRTEVHRRRGGNRDDRP